MMGASALTIDAFGHVTRLIDLARQVGAQPLRVRLNPKVYAVLLEDLRKATSVTVRDVVQIDGVRTVADRGCASIALEVAGPRTPIKLERQLEEYAPVPCCCCGLNPASEPNGLCGPCAKECTELMAARKSGVPFKTHPAPGGT